MFTQKHLENSKIFKEKKKKKKKVEQIEQWLNHNVFCSFSLG